MKQINDTLDKLKVNGEMSEWICEAIVDRIQREKTSGVLTNGQL